MLNVQAQNVVCAMIIFNSSLALCGFSNFFQFLRIIISFHDMQKWFIIFHEESTTTTTVTKEEAITLIFSWVWDHSQHSINLRINKKLKKTSNQPKLLLSIEKYKNISLVASCLVRVWLFCCHEIWSTYNFLSVVSTNSIKCRVFWCDCA